MSDRAALIESLRDWDEKMSKARVAGVPVPERDCDEVGRLRALLRIEERKVAKERESGK